MNPFLLWLQSPALSRLGEVLLHFLWQGAAVAAVLAVVLMRWRNRPPADRYGVACVGLFLLPLLTWFWLDSAVATPAPEPAVFHPGSPSPGFSTVPAPARPWIRPVLPWLALGWAAGTVVLGIRLLGGWIRVGHLGRTDRSPAPASWSAVLEDVAAGLGIQVPVTLWESARIRTPMILGWLRPVVLFPVGLLAGLPPGQVRALLAHELAHLRRHDYLVNLCQSLVEAVLFYHPAVWWISRQIRLERERCCDELAASVLEDRRILAEALVTLAECQFIGLPLAMAAAGGSLTERVQRLLREPAPVVARSGLGFVLSLLGASALGAAAILGFQRFRIPASVPRAPASDPAFSGLARLSEQLKNVDAQVLEQQERLDKLGADLALPEALVEAGPRREGILEDTIQGLTARQHELRIRGEQTREELRRLQEKPAEELRFALQASHPNPLLGTLMNDLTTAEGRREVLLTDFGPQHPEVVKITRVIESIRSQLDRVAQGILGSLQAKAAAGESETAQIERQIAEARAEQVALTALYHPYLREKRSLETLRRMREAMVLQMTQEAINTALSARPSITAAP
ncbi:MAG: M48 family metalloprotease [Verrucomicrobia bacterium]|nr:M48 family metalloprotease [Verrucomicrobiota bacterium]